MGVRTILRLAMIGLAVVVGLAIWARWEPDPATATDEVERPAPELATGDRDVRSSTSTLDVAQHVDDRQVLHIAAGKLLDYEDGWNIWETPEVDIMGSDPAATDDDVHVTGDTMRTAGDVGRFTEVRIIGNVSATLPGGGAFTTRRIDYDAVTGVASNCNRNNLAYAGLDIRSDCLEFATSGGANRGNDLRAEDLRMWGDLSFAADPERPGGLPDGLSGSGSELRFRPGADRVAIDGEANLSFGGTTIRAAALELAVGGELRDLEGVRASGDARLRIDQPDADTDPVLSGDELEIEMRDNTVATVRASGSPARLQLQGQGVLVARSVEMTTLGDTLAIVATGRVEWSRRGEEGTGPRSLSAGTLELTTVAGVLQQLDASDEVVLEVGDEEEGSFAGPRVSMRWESTQVVAAAWPEGVSLDAEGRRASAGAARYLPAGWRLEGTPRPTVEAEGLDLAANAIDLRETGEIVAIGDVVGTLGGSRLASGAALFGDAAEVEVRAGIAALGAEGQTQLRESVQVVWGNQSLVTEDLRLDRDPGRLRALRGVELVASLGPETAPDDPEAAGPQPVTVTAQDMLVEQDSGEIRVAGEARLRHAERTIGAERMAILLGEDGGWERIEAEGEVEFREPEISAEGARLVYDLDSGELLLLGDEDTPARFVYGELEYRSPEALRVLRQGEELVIEATEAGRTITKVVRPDEGTGGAAFR